MSNLEFIVVDAKDGSPNQKKVGIMANFNLNVIVDGTTILTLRDLRVQKSKKGNAFIAFPSRKYAAKDGTERYINFVEFFPGSEDPSPQKAILDQVRRIVESTSSIPKAPVQEKPPTNTSTTGGTAARW